MVQDENGIKIIAGLGNPGIRYHGTRHNVGFMVISALATRHGIRVAKKGYGGMYGIGRVARREVMLFKPMTYMNLSGEAVQALCSSELESVSDLLVVSDDVNLPLGRLRFREQGSAGGHNGLRSIIRYIGEDFPRLRIGVDMAPYPDEMASYVLSRFKRHEAAEMKKVVENAVSCITTWISDGPTAAMERYNSM